MKITKNSSETFDYIKSIKKINKIQNSQNNLSKENNLNEKIQNSTKKMKDPIFNENIPIKVRLIQAAHLNPNINFTQIKTINKKKNILKTENNNNLDEQKDEPKLISVKKSNFGKVKILPSSNKNQKELEEYNNDSNINSENNNLKTFKYNYIKKKIISKQKEEENIENVDFERKTYDKEIPKTNHIHKKSKSKFNIPLSKLEENEEDHYTKNILNSEQGRMKKGRGIFSTDNIFSNVDNIYLDKSILKNDMINKLYNLNTVILDNKENNLKEKINTPISVQTYNNTNSYNITNNNYKYIYLNSKNEKVKIDINSNNKNDNTEIKLDDLILFEEKLNDIYIALNTKNVYEDGASKECSEFISFYFHSSLKSKFTYFFNGMNKVIIKSAINLILYTVIISYHLSLNPAFLNKLNRKLKSIFSLLKLNLYLFIKKIQLYYGEKFTKKNDVYFRNFNYILIQEGIYNCNESKIVKIVNKNCYEIVSYLDKILDFYKSVENNYYQDFREIFSSISKLDEIDIHNYFYKHLYIDSSIDKPKPKINITKNKNKFYDNKNNMNNVSTETNETTFSRPSLPVTKMSNDLIDINNIIESNIKLFAKNKNKEQENNIILDYEKNMANPPFLKNKNQKKFTLVLDLEETLVHINQKGDCLFRHGLYKFLKELKPYYELVSFSNESKYSPDQIIDIIETTKKFFDYNLYREHLTFCGKEFIKDISKLGRDLKKVIIVDNIANNFKLNPENGIQIAPFFGDENDEDNVLEDLKKILILFVKEKYEDLRIGIKKYKKIIKEKITKSINN